MVPFLPVPTPLGIRHAAQVLTQYHHLGTGTGTIPGTILSSTGTGAHPIPSCFTRLMELGKKGDPSSNQSEKTTGLSSG